MRIKHKLNLITAKQTPRNKQQEHTLKNEYILRSYVRNTYGEPNTHTLMHESQAAFIGMRVNAIHSHTNGWCFVCSSATVGMRFVTRLYGNMFQFFDE